MIGSVPTDERTASRGRPARRLAAALTAIALAVAGLAAASPASATDSYKAPGVVIGARPASLGGAGAIGVAVSPDGTQAGFS